MAQHGNTRVKSSRKYFFSLSWKEVAGLLLIVVCATLLLLPLTSRSPEAQRRAVCQNNLRRLGSAFLMYASEDPAGRLPRMHGYESFGTASNAPGCLNVFDDFDFGPDLTALYPNYVDDPVSLVCPSQLRRERRGFLGFSLNDFEKRSIEAAGLVREDVTGRCAYTDRVTNGDVSYTYLPWVVGHDTTGFHESPVIDEELAAKHDLPLSGPAQLVALAIWLNDAQALGLEQSREVLDQDIDLAEVLGALGDPYAHAGCYTGRERQTVLRRARNDVWRDLADIPASYFGSGPPSQSEIPILFDHAAATAEGSAHIPWGGNVLYLDGHVEFVKYPTRFPVSESWAQVTAAVRHGRRE